MSATTAPAWVQWVSAVTSIVVAFATLGLALLTHKYVNLTRALADAASQQLTAAAEERRQAKARARRALGVVAEHLLAQVTAIAPAVVPYPHIEYRPLLDSPLPRMTREMADLILLARDVGRRELEKAHDAATALSDLASYATRVQSAVGVQLLGTQQEALPDRIAKAKVALEVLRDTDAERREGHMS